MFGAFGESEGNNKSYATTEIEESKLSKVPVYCWVPYEITYAEGVGGGKSHSKCAL